VGEQVHEGSRGAAEPEAAGETIGSSSGVSRRVFLGGVAAGAVGLATAGSLTLGVSPALAQGEPFVGEIRMFGGNFAINGWAFCNGQLLPIGEYEALFGLIGTTYGGDGENTFALPNLQGRMPLHQGTKGGTFVIGQSGGEETVTLVTTQIPVHSHVPLGSSAGGTTGTPTGTSWATLNLGNAYSTSAPVTAMNAGALATAGQNQPHDNMSPYVAVTFIIALFGIFPQEGSKRKKTKT
jgi:microcystin-dependent protein